jgi:hypothetical protein
MKIPHFFYISHYLWAYFRSVHFSCFKVVSYCSLLLLRRLCLIVYITPLLPIYATLPDIANSGLQTLVSCIRK